MKKIPLFLVSLIAVAYATTAVCSEVRRAGRRQKRGAVSYEALADWARQAMFQG